MSMTRKRFLSLASSAAVLAAGRPLRMLASPAPRVVSFRFDSFTPLVGRTFSIAGPGGMVHVVLAQVKDGPKDRRTDQFTLVFAAENGTVLPEGTYEVTFPDLRTFPLFVIPAGNGDAGVLFRCDFNLLK